jgi:hypothetical protein
MIDTINISFFRDFNNDFYESLIYRVYQKQKGYFLNHTTGIYQSTEIFNVKANTYSINDNSSKKEQKEVFLLTGHINLPSHNYDIHYRVFENRVDIEFSLPKLIYGTNTFELTNHYLSGNNSLTPYGALVKSVKYFFNYFFPTIKINYGAVVLNRWDLCFNQIFKDKEESLKALHYIKLKHSKKTDTQNYETSFISLSKTKYFKIYHKGSEFTKHDLKKFKSDQLNRIQTFADSILRFEKKITAKNINYFYVTKFKFKNQPFLVKEYVQNKKLNKLTPMQKKEFDNVNHYSLGTSLLYNTTKLDKDFFDKVYYNFRAECKKRYSLGSASVSQLRKQVLGVEKVENKTMKIKILAMIKTFGSLNRALENKAISRASFYRYRDYMDKYNLSETNVRININQDFTNKSYHNKIRSLSINVYKLSKTLDF